MAARSLCPVSGNPRFSARIRIPVSRFPYVCSAIPLPMSGNPNRSFVWPSGTDFSLGLWRSFLNINHANRTGRSCYHNSALPSSSRYHRAPACYDQRSQQSAYEQGRRQNASPFFCCPASLNFWLTFHDRIPFSHLASAVDAVTSAATSALLEQRSPLRQRNFRRSLSLS